MGSGGLSDKRDAVAFLVLRKLYQPYPCPTESPSVRRTTEMHLGSRPITTGWN